MTSRRTTKKGPALPSDAAPNERRAAVRSGDAAGASAAQSGASPSASVAELGASLPEVLLPYQHELLTATNTHQVVVCEKSRRIGATWGVAADAVLTAGATKAAGGMDVLYIAYNLDMTREFIDACAMWSKAFAPAAASVEELLFDDGEDRSIKAFRIAYASGFEIMALSSRPRSLRGKQGYVILDEGAFHDELSELLKAALALLIWGGKVLIISTHNGVDNPFNQLLVECRAGKRPFHVVRTTFDDAIKSGLYRRVCLMRGIAWTEDGEREWAAGIRRQYGEAASEELDCIPAQSGGKYLNRTLLEARATDAPVLRWSLPDSFVDLPEDDRIAQCETWCRENIDPLVADLSASRSFVGQDFGRTGDLSVQWPVLLEQDMRRRTPFIIELRKVPFRQQEQVLFYLCDHLPRFSGAALDARGNGQYLAEVTRQKYGAEAVAEVMLSEGWYRENMPKLKSALEDSDLDIPRDADVIDDFRTLEVVKGVARVPDGSRKTATGQRHGDSAVAACLALFASNTLDAGPLDASAAGRYTSVDAFGEQVGGNNYAGWND